MRQCPTRDVRRKLLKEMATYFSSFGAVALALLVDSEVASSMGTNEVVNVEADLSMEGRLGAQSWRQPHRSPC